MNTLRNTPQYIDQLCKKKPPLIQSYSLACKSDISRITISDESGSVPECVYQFPLLTTENENDFKNNNSRDAEHMISEHRHAPTPNFYNFTYNIQKSSSTYMINLRLSDVRFLLMEQTKFGFSINSLKICHLHKMIGFATTQDGRIEKIYKGTSTVITPKDPLFEELIECPNCVELCKYQSTFNVWCSGQVVTFFSPVLWQTIQFNLFIKYIKTACKAQDLKLKSMRTYWSTFASAFVNNASSEPLSSFPLHSQIVVRDLATLFSNDNSLGRQMPTPATRPTHNVFPLSISPTEAGARSRESDKQLFDDQENDSCSGIGLGLQQSPENTRRYYEKEHLLHNPTRRGSPSPTYESDDEETDYYRQEPNNVTEEGPKTFESPILNLTFSSGFISEQNRTGLNIVAPDTTNKRIKVCFEKREFVSQRCYCCRYGGFTTKVKVKPKKSKKTKKSKNTNVVQSSSLGANELQFSNDNIFDLDYPFTIRPYPNNITSDMPFTKPSDWKEKENAGFRLIVSTLCQALKLEKDCHNNMATFNNSSFKNGTISKIRGGKNSFMRNRVLGSKAAAFRFTITIDFTLPPGTISLPRVFEKNFPSCSPYGLLNRSPSIQEGSLVVVAILFHSDPHDHTCHIDSFIVEGLNANQDGDEVNIFYLPKYGDSNLITPELKSANIELINQTWRYGRRHNMFYECKYSFSPFHKFLIKRHDETLTKYSALWRKLEGNTNEKCQQIMELGCSIMRDQVDDFIELVLSITEQNKRESVTIFDCIAKTGRLEDVIVTSGAKGDEFMLNLYYEKLNLNDNSKYLSSEKSECFNKNVSSGKRLGDQSKKQFAYLTATNGLVLENDSILLNERIIIQNVSSAYHHAFTYFNPTAISYVVKNIMSIVHLDDASTTSLPSLSSRIDECSQPSSPTSTADKARTDRKRRRAQKRVDTTEIKKRKGSIDEEWKEEGKDLRHRKRNHKGRV